jgi:sporulation protein YlmC with PRC-barrel domain
MRPYKRRVAMRKIIVAGLMGVMMAVAAGNVAAQVAGSTTIGVPATEMTILTKGWSAKKQILDKSVYNEQNEKVGEVVDIIVAPDKAISYAIVSVGGFLGMGEHYVTIPFNQLKADDGKFVLRGATKDALKALPPFEYAKAK